MKRVTKQEVIEQIASLSEENERLKRSVVEHANDAKSYKDSWITAQQQQGSLISDRLEKERLERVVSIVKHIADGNTNDAIKELLQPHQLLFNLDVRFADDKTRQAAENEMLAKVVGTVTETLQKLQIKRDGEE